MAQKPNGAIIYRGPSQLDGKPIVVIVTGLAKASANKKTGAMLQTWILRADVEPNVAIKSGEDDSICGACPHRGVWNQETGKWSTSRTCYVLTHNAPLSVFRAYHRGNYPDYSESRPAIAIGLTVRIGSYGDPYAVPLDVWTELTHFADAWTGYSHQWDNMGANETPVWAALVMASVDSAEQATRAQSRGWRTFRVMPKGHTAPKTEVLCPASKEAGANTTCAACKLCMGATSKSTKSIAINLH